MFLDTGTRLFNLDHFSRFDVGSASETSSGAYPVRAFYADSNKFEVIAAYMNLDHCYEFLHKLSHLTDAVQVDMHSHCGCDSSKGENV